MPTDPCTEEYLLPQVEALLAGTLALMTGLSQTEGPCARRELMRDKVRANLQEQAGRPVSYDDMVKENLHQQYLDCGLRDRDDTGYMKSIDPTFENTCPRW